MLFYSYKCDWLSQKRYHMACANLLIIAVWSVFPFSHKQSESMTFGECKKMRSEESLNDGHWYAGRFLHLWYGFGLKFIFMGCCSYIHIYVFVWYVFIVIYLYCWWTIFILTGLCLASCCPKDHYFGLHWSFHFCNDPFPPFYAFWNIPLSWNGCAHYSYA